MQPSDPLLTTLRQAVGDVVTDVLLDVINHGDDRELNRINVFDVARKRDLPVDPLIGGFLHASRLGLFEMSWNVLCPGCGGVLDKGLTLKSLRHSEYHCALCAAGYEPTLDEMVEVTFTVSPRVRRIMAHDPESLPMLEFARQIFWSSGSDLPEQGLEELFREIILESVELPPGEKAILSLTLPEAFVIVFDPVTHTTQFLDVRGEPTRERQQLSLIFSDVHTPAGALTLQPGPVRISFENQTSRRALPGLWLANDAMHTLLGRRKPFLTAKRLLSNQTFRNLYRTDTLEVDQRLKITNLSFVFTDLKGSTALYDRVGDLVAFDLVQAHFRLLLDIVAAESGAVVKTIGDAVMATFPSADLALSAAMRMREAMSELNATRGREDLLLNIGLHAGPCLAVMLDERQDYFGQTVNIASRVQGLADSRAILATSSIMDDPGVGDLLQARGVSPQIRQQKLRGIQEEMTLYEIT